MTDVVSAVTTYLVLLIVLVSLDMVVNLLNYYCKDNPLIRSGLSLFIIGIIAVMIWYVVKLDAKK